MTSRRGSGRGVVALLLVLSVVTGCGNLTGSRSSDMETFTTAQAFEQVDRHIQAAVDRIDPRPELEDREMGDPLECEMGDGHSYLVESRYRLHGVPPERNGEIFDALHGYWSDNGYSVTTDQREGTQARRLQVRHREDGFSVSLRESIQGGLTLSGSSPCVRLSDYSVERASADPYDGSRSAEQA